MGADRDGCRQVQVGKGGEGGRDTSMRKWLAKQIQERGGRREEGRKREVQEGSKEG